MQSLWMLDATQRDNNFHSFLQKNEELLFFVVLVCCTMKIEKITLNKNSRLCLLHFKENDFITTSRDLN